MLTSLYVPGSFGSISKNWDLCLSLLFHSVQCYMKQNEKLHNFEISIYRTRCYGLKHLYYISEGYCC